MREGLCADNLDGMNQIELNSHEYRAKPLRGHVLDHKAFKRAAYLSAVWFVAVVAFGRLFDHGLAWYFIAAPAFAPALLLAFLAFSIDD